MKGNGLDKGSKRGLTREGSKFQTKFKSPSHNVCRDVLVQAVYTFKLSSCNVFSYRVLAYECMAGDVTLKANKRGDIPEFMEILPIYGCSQYNKKSKITKFCPH